MPQFPKNWPAGLVIRASRPDDAADMAELIALPGFRAGTLRLPYPRQEQVRSWLEGQTENTVNLMAVLDGKIVGNAGLNRLSGRRAHAAGLGIGIHDDFVGRGIGTALISELVDMADNWLDIRRLELNVYTDNSVAVRLYEKFGFRREGVFVGYAYREGAYVDSLAMARLRA
ncbi:MAG: GNAT family N-acetyltransferase [Alphaproteobacteria bacterium]|nr:GNAT family N-acetyltransferase [Alphaproteobacteria bacterium]MBU1560269.1 GNAT family N-acetyltransferase [Alphaproteobacteria bacterium]MBU2303594.1 GNAT family N-acetyltransferase [Alphaproteobacteria bacterium]MBU2366193.1 GNAT family N-acetyltransferase [Alphaproteobacteria bacterium]